MARVKNINREAMQTGKIAGNLGFTLLLLILVLPFLGVSYLLNTELDNETRFIARQKAGFEYVNIVRTLLEHVQQHRGIANAYLSGVREFESRLPVLVARIDEDIRAVERLHTTFEFMSKTSGKWMAWRKDWLQLQQQHLKISSDDNFDAHTVLIDELLSFIREAVNDFRLVLDTQLDSRALAEAVMQMPWQMEDMGQARGLGTGIVARGHIRVNDRVRFRALGQSISEGTNDLVRNMTVLFERNPSMQARLSPVFDESVSSINRFLGMVLKQITDSAALDVSASAYFNIGTIALDDFYRLFDAIESELDGLLMARLENTQHKRTLLQVSTLLVLAVTVVIYFIFLRHQAALAESRQKIQVKARALERSNQELDQFAYIASHDLKAPLRAIANLSQWVEEDLDAVMSDDTRKQMALLRSRVQRMEGLINGILQYSRVGRIDMEIEEVDVRQLLDEVLDGLAPPSGFRIEIAADMPTLQTARVPLSQIFANLFSNAIKYHDRPESARITVSVQPLNDAVYEFAVTDDGPGIAPEYHDKIFQIFQTLNARDKVESTGVGLTVVKKIIEQLGGEISLDSEEGHGSTFRFTLPDYRDKLHVTSSQATRSQPL